MRLATYLAILAAIASFALFAAALNSGSETLPPNHQGDYISIERGPPPSTPWASMTHDGRAVGGIPPAGSGHFVPTPVPPTPTVAPPAPTAEPEYIPPPSETERVETPAYAGDWQSAVCSMPWSCEEALYIIQRESGGNQWAVNSSSGACGLFQLLPCPGTDIAIQIAGAYAKWLDGGGSFHRHWYAFW